MNAIYRYCEGQYPPALSDLIASRHNFKQLEDFNVEKDEASAKYNKEYMDRMAGRKKAQADSSDSSSKKSRSQATPMKNAPEYVGCYARESDFGEERVYAGDEAGAQIKKAMAKTLKNSNNYFAIARNGISGHSFSFSELNVQPNLPAEECSTPCLDLDSYGCGCSDDTCGGLSKTEGEEHLRRWAVYKVSDEAKSWYAAKKAAAKAKKQKKE